jgi:hypothetical protein
MTQTLYAYMNKRKNKLIKERKKEKKKKESEQR